MKIPKDHAVWLKRHAEIGSDDIPRCKTSKARIKIRIIGRSIWIRPFNGGFGGVERICHLYCPVCMPNPQFPEYGEPIYDDELIDDLHHIVYKPQPAP